MYVLNLSHDGGTSSHGIKAKSLFGIGGFDQRDGLRGVTVPLEDRYKSNLRPHRKVVSILHAGGIEVDLIVFFDPAYPAWPGFPCVRRDK